MVLEKSPRRTRNSGRRSGGSGDEAVLFEYTATGADDSHFRDTITLYRGDMGRLDEGEFLNDSLVDFHLKSVAIAGSPVTACAPAWLLQLSCADARIAPPSPFSLQAFSH